MRMLSVVLLLFAAFSMRAAAAERIALVIGNAAYTQINALDNAGHDAELIAAALESVGFKVSLLENATQDELKNSVARFGRNLRQAGPDAVGLFYYAGHGVQSFGYNYLLPVDAKLTVAADLDLVGLEASSVLRQMASARNRTNIVILDACRNNPFVNVPDINDNGLAEMKAPTGTFLAYATAPGSVALDGVSGNSPFSAALAATIPSEGLSVEEVFKRVRNLVIAQTDGKQTPWDTSSLTQDFEFAPAKAMTADEIAEKQLWLSVKQSRDPVQLMLFMRNYKDGPYTEEARALLAEVMSAELQPKPKADSTETAAKEPERAAPASNDPAGRESALMEKARASGKLADYEAYLAEFPKGTFAELVKIEIAAIKAKASKDPEQRSQTKTETAAALPPQPAPLGPSVAVFFDKPLTQGAPQIVGKTILEVTKGSPLYPPIEGLPENMWKNQTCSNCHHWTREALCNQGKFYQKASSERSLQKEHPLGGTFKRTLRNWADNSCQ